ncbi:MAG: hypothetical protein NTZ07_01160 [Candidatus Woesebacteria bacterium]|nr:hypothetical protein [Candidatus Woesebacteria bacterium]
MKKNILLFLFLLLFLNLLLLDFYIFKTFKAESRVLSTSTSACPQACVDLIQRGKVGAKELVIPISTSGSTVATDWESLAGSEISFNKANYPGVKKMYFQANLGTSAEDRKSFARLLDVTHGIGVQGSDITSTAVSPMQIKSDSLNFFSGDLVVRIQLKSLNGNTVTISNGRIILTY